jgi:DNA-binding transcriptional regulator/RsmH inhibitor MraZ
LILQESQRYGIPCIRVLTMPAFAEMEKNIREHPDRTIGQKREALEALYAGILPVTVNNQGKLLIPKEWSTRANIAAEANVRLVGRGNYFDIYNSADFEQVDQKQKASVLAAFGDLGIF